MNMKFWRFGAPYVFHFHSDSQRCLHVPVEICYFGVRQWHKINASFHYGLFSGIKLKGVVQISDLHMTH